MWFAGIDWANAHHDIVIIDETGRQVGSCRVDHSPQGLHDLKIFLESVIGSERDQVACIIETNHGLLITALLEAGYPVFPVNPKTVDRRRAASGAKTDLIDAYLLAKTGRADFADLRRLEPDSPKVAELKALCRDQDRLIQSQTRLVNQLTACLKAYYPIALQLFSKLQQRSTLVFLQTYPTPEQARKASDEQIAQALKQAGHPMAKMVAPKIVETLHQPQLQADSITTRTKSRLMLALIAQLLPLVAQIATYDKEIDTLFASHADSTIFASLPGAGKRLAPRLLAEWGDDRKRYSDAASLQALAGTSPAPYESGNYSKMHQRYACVKPLRNAMQQFAWQSTAQEPWARAYYQRKRLEGKSHSMAVRALANVWVRILFAMWQKQESYDRTIFEKAQRLHVARAA
jgi:transposase